MNFLRDYFLPNRTVKATPDREEAQLKIRDGVFVPVCFDIRAQTFF